MPIITIICSTLAVILGVLLWDHLAENRNLSRQLSEQKNINLELLKRIPAAPEGETAGQEPLTVEKIADAVRMEGFFPETEGAYVKFKVQGDAFYVDAYRLPLFFLVKGYGVDPADWEMDLLREAAHKMSDELVMVKATFSDDGKSMRFFVAAEDRNYESFRANLSSYLSMIADGERLMNEEYNKMVETKREAALAARPVIPSAQTENKILS